jgi:integrase/recombinase XerD
VDAADLRDLGEMWLTRLRTEGKSRHTIAAYRSALRSYAGVPGQAQMPGWPGADLSRGSVEAWTAASLDAGTAPGTAELRCTALRSLSAYLTANGEFAADPLAGLKAPRRADKVVRGLGAADLAALIGACKGTSFADRRDMAIVRLMASTGLRCNEVLSMTTDRLDARTGEVIVHGKGSRERRVAFAGPAAEALSWYLRARRAHPRAASPRLWLGGQGKEGFGYNALFRNLRRRAELAGIDGFHPHRIRHGWAAEWLRRGGSESGLQKVAGWKDGAMLRRYVEDVAADLAIEEARRLGIGDL